MKRMPDGELELMMIIWEENRPISRIEIEKKLDRDILPSTILSYLSRLEDKGFVSREKRGKINYYSAVVDKDKYLREAGKNILDIMFGGSLKNFTSALYDGDNLSKEDIYELQKFIDSKLDKYRST